ncbi:MAG: ABC transporter transmembrane domain-containing protein, partial [Elusimicrobiales bacterium]
MISESLEETPLKEKINYSKGIKVLYSFARKYKKNFLKAIILFIITTVIRLSGPLFIKQIIDVAIKNKDIKYLFIMTFGYLGINIVYFTLNYSSLILLIKNGQNLIYDLKNKIYSHILSLDIDYFSYNNPGKLAARVQSDSTSVYDIFTEISITIFVDIIIFITVFSIMAYHNLELTLLLIPVIISIIILITIFIKKSQKLFIDVRKKIAELTSFLSENLNFMSSIRVFSIEDKINEKLELANREKFLKTVAAEYMAILFFLTIMLFDPISKSVIFSYGGVKVLNSYMTIGTVVMFVLYVGQLFEPLFRFSEYVSTLQKSFAAVERVNQILSVKTNLIDGKKYLDKFDNEIRFSDVWMKYPSSDWILKGISFSL